MNRAALICAVIGAAVVAGVALAEDPPANAPTTMPTKGEKKAKAARIPKPYSELTDLTAEQKEKISKLHQESLEEKKKIDDKEDADEMDVLTDDQKTELKKLEDEDKMEMKEKRKSATSKPAKM